MVKVGPHTYINPDRLSLFFHHLTCLRRCFSTIETAVNNILLTKLCLRFITSFLPLLNLVAACPPPFNDFYYLGSDTQTTKDLARGLVDVQPLGTAWTEVVTKVFHLPYMILAVHTPSTILFLPHLLLLKPTHPSLPSLRNEPQALLVCQLEVALYLVLEALDWLRRHSGPASQVCK